MNNRPRIQCHFELEILPSLIAEENLLGLGEREHVHWSKRRLEADVDHCLSNIFGSLQLDLRLSGIQSLKVDITSDALLPRHSFDNGAASRTIATQCCNKYQNLRIVPIVRVKIRGTSRRSTLEIISRISSTSESATRGLASTTPRKVGIQHVRARPPLDAERRAGETMLVHPADVDT